MDSICGLLVVGELEQYTLLRLALPVRMLTAGHQCNIEKQTHVYTWCVLYRQQQRTSFGHSVVISHLFGPVNASGWSGVLHIQPIHFVPRGIWVAWKDWHNTVSMWRQVEASEGGSEVLCEFWGWGWREKGEKVLYIRSCGWVVGLFWKSQEKPSERWVGNHHLINSSLFGKASKYSTTWITYTSRNTISHFKEQAHAS